MFQSASDLDWYFDINAAMKKTFYSWMCCEKLCSRIWSRQSYHGKLFIFFYEFSHERL